MLIIFLSNFLKVMADFSIVSSTQFSGILLLRIIDKSILNKNYSHPFFLFPYFFKVNNFSHLFQNFLPTSWFYNLLSVFLLAAGFFLKPFLRGTHFPQDFFPIIFLVRFFIAEFLSVAFSVIGFFPYIFQTEKMSSKLFEVQDFFSTYYISDLQRIFPSALRFQFFSCQIFDFAIFIFFILTEKFFSCNFFLDSGFLPPISQILIFFYSRTFFLTIYLILGFSLRFT